MIKTVMEWKGMKTKCAYCNRLDRKEGCHGHCEICFRDAMENLKGKPDHDAEVLGYPDGEAPTLSSKMWKLANTENSNQRDGLNI